MSSSHKASIEFSFRQRFGKINWDQIYNLDLDSILSTGDIESLQPIIENLTYSTLDREDLERIHNSNVVKVFKLSQLAVEYLMSVQTHSQETGNSFISKHKKLYEENCYLKETLKTYSDEIETLKSEYLEKRKKIKLQEALFKQPGVAAKLNKSVTRDNALPCEICSKYFTNNENLERHKKRRHTTNDSMESARTVDWAPMFDMIKTFTEQKMSLIYESNKKEIESLRELLKLQVEIQSQKESNYFEQMVKLLKDQQALMQDEKYNSLMMEMKFEKEKLNEDFEEDLRRVHDTERKLKILMDENEKLSKEVNDRKKNFHDIMSNENSVHEIFEENSGFMDNIKIPHGQIRDEREGTPPPFLLQKHLEKIEEKNQEVIKPIQVQEKYDEKPDVVKQEIGNLDKPEVINPIKPEIINKPVQLTVESQINPAKQGQVIDFESARPVNIEDEYDIPVLKSEVSILHPTHIRESNAGELSSDSESESSVQKISNCGDIISDSEESHDSFIETKEKSQNIEKVSKLEDEFQIKEEEKKNYDSFSDKSNKSQKIIPKVLNDEEIAKSIGINPNIHKRYMFIVEKFKIAPLPDTWEEHVQEDGIYFINKEGQVDTINPKIPYFREYFQEIKTIHYNLSDKIDKLTKESPVESLKATSHFRHKPEDILENREKQIEILAGKAKQPKGPKIAKKAKEAKFALVDELLNRQLNNPQVLLLPEPDKSPKRQFAEKEEFKSRDFSEASKGIWNQGIKLIQNKTILKEKPVVQGGQNFQEGMVLGDSNFERSYLIGDEAAERNVLDI